MPWTDLKAEQEGERGTTSSGSSAFPGCPCPRPPPQCQGVRRAPRAPVERPRDRQTRRGELWHPLPWGWAALPELRCSLTAACHPPVTILILITGTCPHAQAQQPRSLLHSSAGRQGIFLELPGRTVRAARGGRVDAFWSFSRGMQSLLDVNSFSPLSSQLLLSSLPSSVQLIVYCRLLPATS